MSGFFGFVPSVKTIKKSVTHVLSPLVSTPVNFVTSMLLGIFQAGLYFDSIDSAAENAADNLQELLNFTSPEWFQKVFFITNLFLLIFLFIPSTAWSYQKDLEIFYKGKISPLLKWLMDTFVYNIVSTLGSFYKSGIQVLSLYDFTQQVIEKSLNAFFEYIDIDDFVNDETASKGTLVVSSVIALNFAIVALFGVLIATYAFLSNRDPKKGGAFKLFGYEVGKKTVNLAVGLYTLTNLVLYGKNIISPLTSLLESGYPLLTGLISVFTMPFLVVYTVLNFKVYQGKAKKKLIAPPDPEEELVQKELVALSLWSPPSYYEKPSRNTSISWSAAFGEIISFFFPLFVVMATLFKSTAQEFQTTEDSWFDSPYNWMMGFMAFMLTAHYFLAFCYQAKPHAQSQDTIDPIAIGRGEDHISLEYSPRF